MRRGVVPLGRGAWRGARDIGADASGGGADASGGVGAAARRNGGLVMDDPRRSHAHCSAAI